MTQLMQSNCTSRLFPGQDRVAVPTDPDIVAIVEKALCVISLGRDCYVLMNVYGDLAEVPYGALLADWERIAYGLLDKAMRT